MDNPGFGQDLSWGCGGGGGDGGLESAELAMTSVSRRGARHQVQGQPGPPRPRQAHRPTCPEVSTRVCVCVGSRPRRDLRLTQKVILQLIWDSKFAPFLGVLSTTPLLRSSGLGNLTKTGPAQPRSPQLK